MKKAKDTVITFILCGLIIVLIAMSADAKKGAIEGMAICENIIIPSLLPILIITNIIIKTNCTKVFENMFGLIFEKLFKLPKCCVSAVIFGLIGGYPAGGVLTSQLYRENRINDKTAARIMRFNFCGGAAFIITAVGTICLHNKQTGIALYIINIISSIIICIISGFFAKKEEVNNMPKCSPKLCLSDALVKAVEITVKNLINMCAFIILFCAVTSIINIPQVLTPLIEITNGVCKTELKIPFEYYSFFLKFGGLCIHFQLMGILREINMKYIDFLIFRILDAVTAFALSKVYTIFFPESISVFSNLSSPSAKLFQVNTGLSMIMIIGCAVLIFDIENKKLKQ